MSVQDGLGYDLSDTSLWGKECWLALCSFERFFFIFLNFDL